MERHRRCPWRWDSMPTEKSPDSELTSDLSGTACFTALPAFISAQLSTKAPGFLHPVFLPLLILLSLFPLSLFLNLTTFCLICVQNLASYTYHCPLRPDIDTYYRTFSLFTTFSSFHIASILAKTGIHTLL